MAALTGDAGPGLGLGTTVISERGGFIVARASSWVTAVPRVTETRFSAARPESFYCCRQALAPLRSGQRQRFFSVSFILDLATWLALVGGLVVDVP